MSLETLKSKRPCKKCNGSGEIMIAPETQDFFARYRECVECHYTGLDLTAIAAKLDELEAENARFKNSGLLDTFTALNKVALLESKNAELESDAKLGRAYRAAKRYSDGSISQRTGDPFGEHVRCADVERLAKGE